MITLINSRKKVKCNPRRSNGMPIWFETVSQACEGGISCYRGEENV